MGRRPEHADARTTPRSCPGATRSPRASRSSSTSRARGRRATSGNRLFYPRRDAGKEKATIYWRARDPGRPSGPEHVLLDPNTWSTDGSVSLGVWSVSYDGKKVAYTVKANNSDEATLYVMDVATGKKSEVDVIEGAKYASPSWTPGNDAFYYTWLPLAGLRLDRRSPRLRRGALAQARHRSEQGPDRPREDRRPEDVRQRGRRQGRPLAHRDDRARLDEHRRLLPGPAIARSPSGGPLVAGVDARYDVSVDGDRFFVWTNEGAPKYRVFRVDPAHPARDQWKEIVRRAPGRDARGGERSSAIACRSGT